MSVFLVIGSSRGIGLSLVEQLAKDSSNVVIAAARNPHNSARLVNLSKSNNKVTLVTLDVDSTESVRKAAVEVGKTHPKIDYLIHNAAILGEQKTTTEDLQTVFNTNVFGPQRVIEAFIPLVEKSTKKIVIGITSIVGSIALAESISGFYSALGIDKAYLAYRTSKVAFNGLFAGLAADYKKDGVAFVVIHPGAVNTDGAEKFFKNLPKNLDPALNVKPISPDESAAGILKYVHGVTIADTGKLVDWESKPLPF